MYPDQLVSGLLIQIYTVFKTSYTQVQHGMGHFTLFTGHHISLIFIFVNFLRILCAEFYAHKIRQKHRRNLGYCLIMTISYECRFRSASF